MDARLRLAGILRLLENYPESIEQYTTVLAAQPSNPEALKGLAIVYGRTGEKKKAFECYEKLEALGGEDQDFRIDQAFLLKESGDTAKAQEEVLRYLSARPEDRRARILLADIHAKQGHLRQAAQTLIEVLEAFPEDTEASGRLAKLYRELGEPQKAIETIEGLINTLEQSTDPKDMEALSRAMEEYEKAISEHEKDFRDEREKTIRKFRELSVDTAPPEKAKTADDTLMIEDMEPLEEDAVPIINVGGLEPVFAVREVDEELQLEEVEEPVQDEEVSIEDERPPNLVNLLKDQELYEENPALEMFEPPPAFPRSSPGVRLSPHLPRRPHPRRRLHSPRSFPACPAHSFPAGGIGPGQLPERIRGGAVQSGGEALRRDEGALPQDRREEERSAPASDCPEHAGGRRGSLPCGRSRWTSRLRDRSRRVFRAMHPLTWRNRTSRECNHRRTMRPSDAPLSRGGRTGDRARGGARGSRARHEASRRRRTSARLPLQDGRASNRSPTRSPNRK